MRLLLIKLYNSFRSNGFFLMLYHCLRYPILRLKTTVIRRKIFSANDENEIFKKIYEMNWWGSNESISGHGSTLNYTENLRKELPIIFDKFSIHKVFDAPCGDFNWMIKVIKKNNIKYLGADIVESLIKHNNTLFSNDRIKFIHLNILKDEFPEADIWICRDFFIHLSYHDIYRSLLSYSNSTIPYILTTSHINLSGFKNMDIRTGDARVIDLFSEPFFFPKRYKYKIEDWVKPHPPREMILFSRNQIAQLLPKMKKAIRF